MKTVKARNLCNLRWLGGQRELARSHVVEQRLCSKMTRGGGLLCIMVSIIGIGARLPSDDGWLTFECPVDKTRSR